MRSEKNATNYGKPWTRDELILAFELYCRISFQQTKASNPQVQALATRLARSPASIARKLGNFGAFDPELKKRNISGLGHGSKLDREVWEEFHRDWNGLVAKAHELGARFALPIEITSGLIPPLGPSETLAVRKQRIHQRFFREAVLSSYQGTCCITGLSLRACLVASHIVPWSAQEDLRSDPANGLCLSATFDRLFDSGYLTVTRDYRVRVSNRLLRTGTGPVSELICRYHDKPILRPHRFLPSHQHLEWHLQNAFRD
jgi:putative restriction endonuclease